MVITSPFSFILVGRLLFPAIVFSLLTAGKMPKIAVRTWIYPHIPAPPFLLMKIPL
jgi:hypothetical protein